ncbi:hypothetical protein SKB0120_05360 [Moraxella osloensis]
MLSQQVLKIHASIIHRIIKEVNQQAPNITHPTIREKLHANETQVAKLIHFLDDQLEKSGLAHSFSKDFETSQTMAKILGDNLFYPRIFLSKQTYSFIANQGKLIYLSSNKSFKKLFLEVPLVVTETSEQTDSETNSQTRYRRLTTLLTYGLNHFIYQERMTTGDHLPIIFYEVEGKQYLYIALLSLRDNITINEDTGEIIDTTAIDTSALKVACKINLSDMSAHFDNKQDTDFEPKNYVSWIQKGTEKIAEYIQNYIPVDVRIDDKSATTKLMNTLTSFLRKSDFNNNDRGEINKDILRLLNEKAKLKQCVNILQEIDPIINTKAIALNIDTSIEKNNFKIYREHNGYGIDDKDNANAFAPEQNPLKNFEMFDITLGDEDDSFKISGFQSIIDNKIKFDDDPTNPKLEIFLTLDEVEKVRKVFNTANAYESRDSN